MLNRSDQSRYPCFVPDFHGSVVSLSQLSMIIAVDFSYVLRQVKEISRNFCFAEKFLSCMSVEFCQKLFLHLSR